MQSARALRLERCQGLTVHQVVCRWGDTSQFQVQCKRLQNLWSQVCESNVSASELQAATWLRRPSGLHRCRHRLEQRHAAGGQPLAGGERKRRFLEHDGGLGHRGRHFGVAGSCSAL